MLSIPRSFTRLRRRPTAYWAATAALALVSAVVVTNLTGDAASARQRWGATTDLVVVTAEVAAGEALTPSDVALRPYPAALAPPGALHRLPGRAVATVDLVPGEPLLARRIAPGGSSALAARLPNGTRGVAIPHDDTQLPVAKGDVVDVLATFDTGDGGPPTITVARRALVIDVGRAAVTVAVQPDEAPRVAFAVIGGAVSLVLSPAGS